MSGDWAEHLPGQATHLVRRVLLRDGETGWPYERVFPNEYLVGAQRVKLVDTYLAKWHQLRNLKEFLLHLAEAAHPKEMEIVTAYASLELVEQQDRELEGVSRDLFRDYGVALTLRRETGEHARQLLLDHGVLFCLDRGLDIYKPAVGLAAHRPASRKVRKTPIDVFCWPDHPLVTAAQGKT
jgi:hypothetical protein